MKKKMKSPTKVILFFLSVSSFIDASPLLGLGGGGGNGQSPSLLGGAMSSFPGNQKSSSPAKSSSKGSKKKGSKSASRGTGGNGSNGGGLMGGLMDAASAPMNAASNANKKSSKSSSKKKSKGASKGASSALLSSTMGRGTSKQKSPSFGFLMGGPRKSGAAGSPNGGEGFVVDEGDIAISNQDYLNKAVRNIEVWRNGEVFYKFHEDVNDTMKDLFNLAMKEWEDYTCVRFREAQSVDQIFFAKYRTDDDGCYSFVGRQAKDVMRGQDVNLGDGCDSLHTAIHEIGHLLGLSHEQSRSDRDYYIRINYDNIETELQSQFEKQKTRNEEAEYDYKSVMQYPSWGFSVAPFEKITMSSLNPMLQYLLDEERQGLSFKDIKVMNKIYDCERKCEQKLECLNGGALVPYKSPDNSRCVCMCPPGFEGDTCEEVSSEANDVDGDDGDATNNIVQYYGGLRCGGNVTRETTIETPRRKLSVPGCSWWIQAPPGQKIAVKFEKFDFRPKESFGVIDDKCIFEKVEIRAGGTIYEPDIYCGNDLQDNTITSVGPDFIIVVVGDLRGEEKLVGDGLRAKITFKDGGTEDVEERDGEPIGADDGDGGLLG